jgi:asparagine synthase (glutamine-hydrolysing)
MCGIVGVYYFDPSRQVQADHLRLMTTQIRHRGPDDDGSYASNNIGLAMRRLSIIDISGGHQPIFSKDKKSVIVFNGEVYNFKELRSILEKKGHVFTTHTDTEAVLRCYEEYGDEFLEYLNGMYGLAIWDQARNHLIVARDRIGIKPLYYYHDHEKIIWASEIKAILAYPEINAALDMEGLSAYFNYGFTPAPHTLFKNIKKIPPAHYLSITNQKFQVTKYWNISYKEKYSGSENELSEDLYALLKSAVDYQLVADVPLGAFLSGGIDSSSIVHLMKELTNRTTSTYSIGFGDEFEVFNELDAARRFSGDYGTDHHEILVKPDTADLFPKLIYMLDEPLADSSFIMTYLVSKLARESVTVILSGVGGDELFGGYRRYLNVRLNKYIRNIPSTVRSKVLLRILEAIPSDRNNTLYNYVRLAKAYLATSNYPPYQQYSKYTSIFDPDISELLTDSYLSINNFHQYYFDDCDSSDLLDKLLHFDLKTSLPEQLLMLTDKMSMAASLEARVPYLDHRLVEFAARIPERLKIKGFQLRYIQKDAFRGRFPNYVFKQKKKGFGAPIGSWLRHELKEMMFDLLNEESLNKQGLFSAKVVQQIITEHFSLRYDHTDRLLALLTFQLWHKEYIEPKANIPFS